MGLKIFAGIVAVVLMLAYLAPLVIKLKEVSLGVVILIALAMMLVDLVPVAEVEGRLTRPIARAAYCRIASTCTSRRTVSGTNGRPCVMPTALRLNWPRSRRRTPRAANGLV